MSKNFVRLVLFKVAWTMAAYIYFILNPGEWGFALMVFGNILILPCGIISLLTLIYFTYFNGLDLSKVKWKWLCAVAVGDGILIFPLLPFTLGILLLRGVQPGGVTVIIFGILLYPVICYTFIRFYRAVKQLPQRAFNKGVLSTRVHGSDPQ